MDYRNDRARARMWYAMRGERLEGYTFCDEDHYGPTKEQIAFEECFCEQTRHLLSLLKEGVEASTTDADNQGIGTHPSLSHCFRDDLAL